MSYLQYIMIGAFFLLPVFILIWRVYRQGQLERITMGKVLTIQLTRVGSMWFELVNYENEQAKITKDDEAEAGGVALNAVNTFTTQYPPTLKKVGKAAKVNFMSTLFRPTVSINAVVIPEGYPIGYMPWQEEDSETYMKMVDRQMEGMDEQSLEKVFRGVEKSLDTGSSGGLKKSDRTWAMVGMLIIILLAGASAGLAYMNYTEMTSWGW